jgi:hypothetical protein
LPSNDFALTTRPTASRQIPLKFCNDMAFLSLPNEIVLEIVEYLDNPKQIISALSVNRRLHYLLRDYPLQHNIRLQGSSALIWAAHNGRLELVRNILRLQPDIDTKTGSRLAETALQIAAKNGFFTMTKLLLEAGANLNVIDFQDQVPLVTAIVSGHEEIAGMIFRQTNKQAKVLVDSKLDETPLHFACRYKRSKAIRYFLEAGADSNANESTGSTPLQCVSDETDMDGWIRRYLSIHPSTYLEISLDIHKLSILYYPSILFYTYEKLNKDDLWGDLDASSDVGGDTLVRDELRSYWDSDTEECDDPLV